MSSDKKTALIKIVAALMIAVFSVFVVSKIVAAPKLYEKTNQYLDEKKVAVLELAGAAAATSLAVSALPDDLGTPIANELADLSGYFLLIVSAIVFEKYLYGIAGVAAFQYLIPIACGLYILYALLANGSFRKGARKLFAFALAVFLIVPASVKISCFIEEKYNCSAEETVSSVAQEASEIAEEEMQTQQDTNEKAPEKAKEKTWWSGIADALNDTAEKLKSSVSETASSVKEKVNTLLSKFIDAVAVMIVTSCVIPIAVLFALVWLLKLIFSLDWDIKGDTESFIARQMERREKRQEKAEE